MGAWRRLRPGCCAAAEVQRPSCRRGDCDDASHKGHPFGCTYEGEDCEIEARVGGGYACRAGALDIAWPQGALPKGALPKSLAQTLCATLCSVCTTATSSMYNSYDTHMLAVRTHALLFLALDPYYRVVLGVVRLGLSIQ